MANYVILGMQWGDEGKGKIVDVFAKKMDIAVRYQGGNNAGHTVITAQGEEHKLHILPSGVLHPHLTCLIGQGTVIDPRVLVSEMQGLAAKVGDNMAKIAISDNAHVIMPYHVVIDQEEEKMRGSSAIGTTQKGIGPCYADKINRRGIKISDLLNKENFKYKLKHNLHHVNHVLNNLYKLPNISFDKIYYEYMECISYLKPYVTNGTSLLAQSLHSGDNILFEGAQGAMLDIDYGSYPFVTSSSSSSAGLFSGSGIFVRNFNMIIGVLKAYSTRVGAGPFLSEQDNEDGEQLFNIGNEVGVTTGRKRRCGWLDLNVARHSIVTSGVNMIALTKLDILSHFEEIPICVAYEKQGVVYKHVPYIAEDIRLSSPVYKVFKGWKCDISHARTYDELPEEAQAYIEFIETELRVPVGAVSVGPRAEQIIKIHPDLFFE